MEIVTIRASSLPTLFSCPACWEARNIRKITMPASGSARLGTAIHASTALFDTSRMSGDGITIDDAADAAVDAIHKPDEDVVWDELKPAEAERIALSLHHLYCTQIAPLQTYAAVEATCEHLEITDIGLVLTGTVDRVRVTDDGYGIADIKTGKSAVSADGTCKTKGHAAQIAVYELLAEHSANITIGIPAQIIGLQVAKTARGQRAATGTVSGGRELLLGDEDSLGLIEMAARIIHSGTFYGFLGKVLHSGHADGAVTYLKKNHHDTYSLKCASWESELKRVYVELHAHTSPCILPIADCLRHKKQA